ncbi:hypothetical protein OQA88_13429 [Cercophora sp. LCS_1]
MQLTTLATLLATSASIVNAYQVRIGEHIYGSPDNIQCGPVFKVYNDDWSFVTDVAYNRRTCTSSRKRFCATWGCAFQVDGIAIGIRVVEDGGSDEAIRVEAWRGSKSTWTWCKRVTVREGNHHLFWQCDFKGL